MVKIKNYPRLRIVIISQEKHLEIVTLSFKTFDSVDRINVMGKNQIREMENHQKLLAKKGLYFKLYQLQYKDQMSPNLK